MSKYQEATIETTQPSDNAAAAPVPRAVAVVGQVNATTDEADQPPVYKYVRELAFDADNVRKRGKTSITTLKALIKSQGGLIQNLVICPLLNARGKPTGKFGVVGGGRRLRALRELIEEGAFPRDYQVLCKVVSRERAIAISAAENSHEPMTVADTIVAFADMVASGAGVEDIAVAFGITALTVQRRARLANVSPKLFDLFADEKISLDQLMALALTEDHAKQEEVWDTAPSWNKSPASLRQIVLGEAVDASRNRLVKYVGLAAYEAAGGAVIRDLFTDADKGYVADLTLLQQLAATKLEKKVTKVRNEGFAWVEVMVDRADVDTSAFVRAPVGRRAPTDAERASIDAAKKVLADAEQALLNAEASGSADDDVLDPLYTAIGEAQHDLTALEAVLQCVLPEVLQLAGAVVGIDQHGKAQTHRGLIRAEDRKKALALSSPARSADSQGSSDGGAEAASEGSGHLSDALSRKLTSHRTQALQVVLADNTHVALAALTQKLWLDLRELVAGRAHSALDLRGTSCQHELARSADDLEGSRAHTELQARLAKWGDLLPGEPQALLAWLIAQPLDTVAELLALCAALTVNTVTSGKTHACDVLTKAVGLDMADWWTPTVDSYLKQVPKALIVAAVSEAVSPAAAAPLSKLKKGEATARAEALLAGTRWLPSVLRTKEG